MASPDLHTWMHSLGMTPKVLAESLDFPRHEISKIVAGELEMPPMMLYALKGLQAERGALGAQGEMLPKPKGCLPEKLCGTKWAEVTARIGFPVLITLAMSSKREQVTYGEFHELVVTNGAKADVGQLPKYAHVLGKIANAMTHLTTDDTWKHKNEPVPPLTALVVNGQTRMPSNGINDFVSQYLNATGRLDYAKRVEDPKAKHDIYAIIWTDIFKFKRWPEVRSIMGFTGDAGYDA